MNTSATSRSLAHRMTRSRARLAAALRSAPDLLVIALFTAIAGGHFAEHVVQMVQYKLLGWPAGESGGVLGLWFPGLAAAEFLHSGWNTLQLTALILLWPLFRHRGAGALFFGFAIVAQSWHWLEHVLLQVQYLSGHYLFGAIKQRSILELLFPRIELHFVYNLLSFAPTVIAVALYLRQRARERRARDAAPGSAASGR